eukprot:3586027-Prymnesium_polylepis.1
MCHTGLDFRRGQRNDQQCEGHMLDFGHSCRWSTACEHLKRAPSRSTAGNRWRAGAVRLHHRSHLEQGFRAKQRTS